LRRQGTSQHGDLAAEFGLFHMLDYLFVNRVAERTERRWEKRPGTLGGGLVVRTVIRWVLIVGAAMVYAGTPAEVFAEDWGFQFGPVGGGPAVPGAGGGAGYDHSFIREWQANPPKGYATVSTANITATKAAIGRYEAIVQRGGFAPVPEMEMEPGVTNAAVATLRQRLQASGDLKDDSSFPNYFGTELETGVKRFQASNGLAPTAVVDKRTLAALNVPADVRLKQLKANLTRLADLVKAVGHRYVLVNIPAAQVEAVENDQIVSRHSGVVGKPDRPTPLLRSTIVELNFNPMWTLPPTVIKEDLIPKGREMQQAGGDVLAKFGIDAYSNGKKLDTSKID
jgi:peptidoglycan hydrolase-like protein with peptidoglycan-binding domain